MVPFESLGVVSYSHSIATMAVSLAVCEISTVKEWRDLQHLVRCRSKSLKIENSADRWIVYDFLFVGHCKYSSILYHFQVIWR